MFLKYYSCSTWFILVGMILSGAARSIVVKLAYQSGFQAPLTVTLLSFLGKSFSFAVYRISKMLAGDNYDALAPDNDNGARGGDRGKSTSSSAAGDDGEGGRSSRLELELDVRDDADDDADVPGDDERQRPDDDAKNTNPQQPPRQPNPNESTPLSTWSSAFEFYAAALRGASSSDGEAIPNGSSHGLSRESEERIRWVRRVPFCVKPAIPAVLNLLASALRWTSLVYIDASVVEMMVAGLELTLSVVAARILRRRMVARSRWAGVVIVAIGVIIIERANSSKGSSDAHGARDVTIGVILIVVQSVLSVLQDLAEEIFMQASGSEMPATMMLGIEGFYGLVVGTVIYAAFAKQLAPIEDIDSTLSTLRANAGLRWWLAGLPSTFLVMGLFNIKATERTSAMTRNVWKTLRPVAVWAVALTVYYVGDDPALGEKWHVPESFAILFGFVVMSGGIIAYYISP